MMTLYNKITRKDKEIDIFFDIKKQFQCYEYNWVSSTERAYRQFGTFQVQFVKLFFQIEKRPGKLAKEERNDCDLL